MTLTMEAPLITQSGGDGESRPIRGFPSESDSKSSPGEAEVGKARLFSMSLSGGPAERITLLGIVLASLGEIPFEKTARILNTKPDHLTRWMHGTDAIPGRAAERWELVAAITRNLSFVLKPDAFDRWFETRVPDLGNKTPLQLIQAGKARRVVELTESYLDKSFA